MHCMLFIVVMNACDEMLLGGSMDLQITPIVSVVTQRVRYPHYSTVHNCEVVNRKKITNNNSRASAQLKAHAKLEVQKVRAPQYEREAHRFMQRKRIVQRKHYVLCLENLESAIALSAVHAINHYHLKHVVSAQILRYDIVVVVQ